MGVYYKNVEPFLDKIDNDSWIEIGLDRGEGSTDWFADHCKQRNTNFVGIDMNPEQVKRSKATLQGKNKDLPKHITLFEGKGEDWLLANQKDVKISFAYLDNFDWDYWLGGKEEQFVADVKKTYQELLGVPMTNINSQLTHLLQTIHLIPMLSKNSIVVCDDTWYHPTEGIFIGKCSTAINLLMLNGFRILHSEGYRQNSGVILGRFEEKGEELVS